MFRLVGVHEACEAICVHGSLKAKHLYLEPALCSVVRDGFTHVLLRTPKPTSRTLCKGTFLADFMTPPLHVGTITDVLPSLLHDADAQEKKVMDALQDYLKLMESRETKAKLTDVICCLHGYLTLRRPIGATILVENHIPLLLDTSPFFILAFRFSYS